MSADWFMAPDHEHQWQIVEFSLCGLLQLVMSAEGSLGVCDP
jgi:hypothetical protein